MEGDNCSFPPDLSDDHSQRGSVASSATLSRQDVLVYLFGESAVHLSLEGLGSVSVQELGRSVREALQIPESAPDAFAFWLCSPLLLQLKARHQPYKLCRQWQDLLYRFTDASEDDISQQIKDETVLRLLYEEARSNILSGRYPCDPEHWAGLGALSLALEEGPGLDSQQITTKIREKKLPSFVPAHVAVGSGGFFSTLRGKSSRQAELEQKLSEEYGKISKSTGGSPEPQQLLHQYLSMCHSLPYYVLLGLRFSELSWDHSRPEEEGDSHILWLEFDGEEDGTPVNKLLKIYSKQAELMSGFIEFCVELMSTSEGGAANELGVPQEPAGQEAGTRNGRGGRRGMLQRQGSVVCSRFHSLNTISYVDNKEIKRLKPKRAASFFARQATAPTYSAVNTESLEQG
uniref:FERM domain-containing protein 8 n=1 Tax=Poecilia reticulata TaxID=8081 RepID=A0A3P9NEW3_POERE